MLISLCAASVAVVLHAIQRSKCSKISCCGSVVTCTREIQDISVTSHATAEDAESVEERTREIATQTVAERV